jgi:hypothetical protein
MARKVVSMVELITTFRIDCAPRALKKCHAETEQIIADLRDGRLAGRYSKWQSDDHHVLRFVTRWTELLLPDEDWTMDPELEDEIRYRLCSVDPTVTVVAREDASIQAPSHEAVGNLQWAA